MPGEEIRKFWEQTRAELDKVSMDAEVEPVEQMDAFTMEGIVKTRTIYRVILTSFEGRRIRGWYTVPAAQPPAGGWPAIMETPGYGGVTPIPLHLSQYGYATLMLFPRSTGESLKEWQIEHSTRLTYNVTDRDRYYYRGAFMDCIRGLDFLDSRPEIDGSRLGLWGVSQGGGLTLATASLDRRVSAAFAGVPWPCNLPVGAQVTTFPYVELHDYLAEHPGEREAALATLAYFDPLNLVDGITCPLLIAGAIVDDVHPLSTIMPVFERIPSLKSILIYPDRDHQYRPDSTLHGLAWMERYLR